MPMHTHKKQTKREPVKKKKETPQNGKRKKKSPTAQASPQIFNCKYFSVKGGVNLAKLKICKNLRIHFKGKYPPQQKEDS